MNTQIKQLAEQAGFVTNDSSVQLEMFANLLIKECINHIEQHEIPVGNSAAGELACEWTYNALKEIRNEIKEKFGIN